MVGANIVGLFYQELESVTKCRFKVPPDLRRVTSQVAINLQRTDFVVETAARGNA